MGLTNPQEPDGATMEEIWMISQELSTGVRNMWDQSKIKAAAVRVGLLGPPLLWKVLLLLHMSAKESTGNGKHSQTRCSWTVPWRHPRIRPNLVLM